jgi:selenocysteine-specific elongation factor
VRASVLEALRVDRYSPPPLAALLALDGVSRELLAAMTRDGSIVRISPEVYLVRDVFDEMSAWVLQAADHDGVSLAEVRDRFRTSRRYAQALLEYLDGERYTRRQGDVHVRGSRTPVCA